jgi:hypothetical protein
MKIPTSAFLFTGLTSSVTHGFSPVSKIMQSRSIYASKSILNSETSSLAEKVLLNPKWPPEWPYTATDLARMDESQDTIFYDSPRL